MNLLQAFEGLNGEVLGTAALRVILLDNPAAREAIIDLISDESATGPLVSNVHFACYRELGTTDESGQSGRLDLVLELDNAVIGIEAKFFAPIQPQQATKYLTTLGRRAELLAGLRGAPVLPQLFLLAPEAARATYQPFLSHSSFLSWEAVSKEVDQLVQRGRGSSTLERDFVEFVRGKLDYLPRLTRELRHLTRAWQPRGTDLQSTFMQSVYYTALGLSGGRLTRTATWCGYYLNAEVWLGFAPSPDSAQTGRSGLVLTSTRELTLPEKWFRRVRPAGFGPPEGSSAGPARYEWLVEITLDWANPMVVRQLFEPVTRAVPSIGGPGKTDGASLGPA